MWRLSGLFNSSASSFSTLKPLHVCIAYERACACKQIWIRVWIGEWVSGGYDSECGMINCSTHTHTTYNKLYVYLYILYTHAFIRVCICVCACVYVIINLPIYVFLTELAEGKLIRVIANLNHLLLHHIHIAYQLDQLLHLLLQNTLGVCVTECMHACMYICAC